MNRVSIPKIFAKVALVATLFLALTASVAVAKTFVGTEGPDTIKGTNKADFIRGLGGNDTLQGRLGNDRIYGGTGNDLVRGQPGNDTLNGGPGNDRLYPQVGADKVYGARGNDRILVDGDEQRDYVFCGPGYDTVFLALNDVIFFGDERIPANKIVASTNAVLSCERIYVNRVLVVNVPITDEPVLAL